MTIANTRQLITADQEERSKAIDALGSTSYVIARYEMIEKDYMENRVDQNAKFGEAVTKLYGAIVLFYAKATCYFSRHTPSRTLRNVLKYDDWTAVVDGITKQDQVCKEQASVLFQSSLATS